MSSGTRCAAVLLIAGLAGSFAHGQAYYRFEEGAANAVATGGGSIIDSLDGSNDGTPFGGPIGLIRVRRLG